MFANITAIANERVLDGFPRSGFSDWLNHPEDLGNRLLGPTPQLLLSRSEQRPDNLLF